MSKIRSGRVVYSDGAHKKLMYTVVALAQKVMRESTAREKKLIGYQTFLMRHVALPDSSD